MGLCKLHDRNRANLNPRKEFWDSNEKRKITDIVSPIKDVWCKVGAMRSFFLKKSLFTMPLEFRKKQDTVFQNKDDRLNLKTSLKIP